MDRSQQVPSVADLYAFVRARDGTVFSTLHQDKTFSAVMDGDRLRIRTGSGERAVRSTEAVLEVFRSTGSLRPSVYRATGTFNASYLLALIAAWQGKAPGRVAGPVGVQSPSVMAREAREKLLEAVMSAANSLDCSVKDTRLTYGLEISKRSNKRRTWVGSVYWGQNNPSNDIEIAFDLGRLAARPGDQEAARLDAWFRYTVTLLENEPANNHSGDQDGWFRAGFKFDDAIDFLYRLKQQSSPLLHEHERWVIPEAGDDIDIDGGGDVETKEGAPGPEPIPVSVQPLPEDHSILHMIRMARLACAASGQLTESINKTKRFSFPDEAALGRHISHLIEQQGRLCAITSLPLHFEGVGLTDEDQLASLDRIDSNGHYAPGNLQIVCRFINRWKSDDSDDNFRRLIALVRSTSPRCTR
jgi:hypothetical protein